MTYNLKITNKGQYIHVKLTGVDGHESFADAWRKIARECRQQASKRILCEGCLLGSGMMMDTHEYGRYLSETEIPVGTRIAIVLGEDDYLKYKTNERTTSTDCPVFPKIFRTSEEGLQWLVK